MGLSTKTAAGMAVQRAEHVSSSFFLAHPTPLTQLHCKLDGSFQTPGRMKLGMEISLAHYFVELSSPTMNI